MPDKITSRLVAHRGVGDRVDVLDREAIAVIGDEDRAVRAVA